MPDIADDTDPVQSYTKAKQKARWQERAEEKDRTMSGFIQDMVELGIKVDRGLDVTFQPDKTNTELREELSVVKTERDRARERNRELEDRLHNLERAAIERHVAENPGTGFDGIKEHLRATVPERAQSLLTVMEGEEIRVNPNGLYFPREDAQAAESGEQEA